MNTAATSYLTSREQDELASYRAEQKHKQVEAQVKRIVNIVRGNQLTPTVIRLANAVIEAEFALARAKAELEGELSFPDQINS